MFRPSRLCGLECYFAALFGGHGSETALAAYSPAASAHFGHDAGDGIGDLVRTLLRAVGSRGSADHLEGGLVHVGGAA